MQINFHGFKQVKELMGNNKEGDERAYYHNKFIEGIINIVDQYGGDVISISGETLMVIWPKAYENAKDLEEVSLTETNDGDEEGDNSVTTLRYAIQCAIDI